MITYYSADYVFPITSPPIPDGVVAVDDDGIVQGVYSTEDKKIEGQTIVRLKGALVPGFVNVHCHLELSHMRGQISEKIGLVNFLSKVMTRRNADRDHIEQAMAQADQQMFEKGIQAVGDHANTEISATIKKASNIHYHTFVEMLGMDDNVDVQAKISQALGTASQFHQERVSLTLHAPYSCSRSLFEAFKGAVNEKNAISIHNQESDEENKLFLHREGAFLDFYQNHGINVAHFEATGRTSVQSYTAWLPNTDRLILVHNAHTSTADLDFLAQTGRTIFYCLCPKSNLYIEGKLPNTTDFASAGVKIVLGTDSLASNDTLDILEEIKTLHEALPDLELTDTLRWATLNGAEALGLADKIGSLETGKKPGLILLEKLDELRLTKDSEVRRIV